MASTAFTNVQQNLAYALSEMGETMTLSADGTTVSTKKDFDRKTPVLAANTTLAQAKAHVLPVHPQISKIVG
jgi:hypothetical protein